MEDVTSHESNSRSSVCELEDSLRLEAMASRCGSDVVRLVADPVSVIGTAFGSGFKRLRLRNGCTILSLEARRRSLRATSDSIRIRGPHSKTSLERSSWQWAFLRIGGGDERESILVAYDEEGRPSLELLFEDSELASLAPELPRLEHVRQRPTVPITSTSPPEPVIHAEFDDDTLDRAWRRRGDYEDIRSLESGFRLDRLELLRALEARWATSVTSTAVTDMAKALTSLELPYRLDLDTPSARTCVRPDEIRSPRGRHLVAIGDEANALLQPSVMQSAFVVYKPCRNGLETAVEFFHSGTMRARLRLADGASSEQHLLWRSCLPSGHVGNEYVRTATLGDDLPST